MGYQKPRESPTCRLDVYMWQERVCSFLFTGAPGPQALTGQSPLTWFNFWLNSCSFSVWPGLELSPSVKGFLVTCNKWHPNC